MLTHFHCPLVNLDTGLEKCEEEDRNQFRLRNGKRSEVSPFIETKGGSIIHKPNGS